ncbi:hypothetical protein CLSA_c20330 [Clostridium saccharobutylicum DSM 13864]|uniref:Uncharacterized protein n=1 Tax=Clostridium saccharobutylicum DSM 13864 TaxID=1345695 RepID=U5MTN3_CLOSA|nr:hypothetical protein CLSA_c20330 [Clostridium saccharobutylicum DSM 13864]
MKPNKILKNWILMSLFWFIRGLNINFLFKQNENYNKKLKSSIDQLFEFTKINNRELI